MFAKASRKVGRKFYMLDKVLSNALVSGWRNDRVNVESIIDELLDRVGASGVAYSGGIATSVYFNESPKSLPEGFKVREVKPGNSVVYLASIDMRANGEAKWCLDKLKDLNDAMKEAPEFGPYVNIKLDLTELSTLEERSDGSVIHSTTSFISDKDGHVYISIPFGGSLKLPKNQKRWITNQFKEVKETTYLSAM